MKSIAAFRLLAASALSAIAQEAATSTSDDAIFTTQAASIQACSPAESIVCPACDRSNVVDAAGSEYTITCNYEIQGEDEDEVEGWVNTNICMDACDDNEDCFGINFTPAGGCSIVKGQLTGMSSRAGYVNMLRILPNSTSPPSSTPSTTRVQITSTTYDSNVSSTATSTALPEPADECNLELINLCPLCNEREVVGKDNRSYRLLCDNTIVSSNGTYSIQAFSSPESCLADCADFPLCEGAIFSGERNCELAKGEDAHPSPAVGETAFIPVATTTPASSAAIVQSSPASGTVSSTNGNATILPIDSGCDLEALSCPACDGTPYIDQLGAPYIVLCNFEPICDSLAIWRDGADSQEQCIQGCDQDATCLAALWYPETLACKMCQQGMDEGVGTNLPYIVLVHDVQADGEPATTTLPAYSPESQSTASYTTITDFPAPFRTTTADSTANANAVSPIGPVVLATLPSSVQGEFSEPIASFPTSFSSVIPFTTSGVPPGATIEGAVSCPAYDGNVFVEPDSGNYFAVGCDSVFTGAHSRFLSASDFAACAAACNGQCDGIQFGYSTRCGIYTDISVVGPGTGWTIAASITFPTPLVTTWDSTTSFVTPAGYSFATPAPQVTAAPSNGTN